MRPIVILALALLPSVAVADQTLVRSTSPYWEVGRSDTDLSRACAMGRFNEATIDLYVARFSGSIGPAVLGIAKGTGLNLYDPDHRADRVRDYFFYEDGTSSCAVYSAGPKK